MQNIFQQQVKETYQSTGNRLPFLNKKTPKKIFLNRKIMSNIRQKEHNIMSVENLMEMSEDLFSLEQIGAGVGTDNTLIF